MQILVPTIVISLSISLFNSTITVYNKNFIAVEIMPHPLLAENNPMGIYISLIDIDKNTISWFSKDLTSGYDEDLSKQDPFQNNWVAMPERTKSSVEIIEETVSEKGRFLKVKFCEEINGGSYSYIIKQFYLLYDIDGLNIPSNVIPFCKLPKHNLLLPPAYNNYQYIFSQWEEYEEEDGTIIKHSYISTTLAESSTPKYSLEELQAIPIVPKDVFYSNTNH